MASGISVDKDQRAVELAVYIFKPKNIISLQRALFPNDNSLHTNK
jgi:hypothetical protein